MLFCIYNVKEGKYRQRESFNTVFTLKNHFKRAIVYFCTSSLCLPPSTPVRIVGGMMRCQTECEESGQTSFH